MVSMKRLRKILIIDDDETTCFLNKIFLEDMQVTEEVDCFQNPQEAFSFLKEVYLKDSIQDKGPDLIFLDINMPVMNGFEFLEKVKQEKPLFGICSKRIVMYTSSKHPKDLERAKQYDILDNVQKPLTKEKVQKLIETYLSKG